jgi:hypothetical protein
MLKYLDFINESIIDSFSKEISIDFAIEGEKHFNDRLVRKDNELDHQGKKEISKEEVLLDIKRSIPQIVSRNLFNNGLNWIPRQDTLNKEICIINSKTNLNILLIIRKSKDLGVYKYIFTIKTVMRKSGFIPYSKDTFVIKIS